MLGIGFFGAGWMGTEHARRLLERSDVEIRRIYNPDAERGASKAAELGLDPGTVTSDERVIADDPAIDAVWVVSPNGDHARQALAALRNGKHVFCEKPAATVISDYRELMRLDREKQDVTTLVNYMLYFDPLERWLFERTASGSFGDIVQLQINYRHPVNTSGRKAWKLQKSAIGDAIGMGIIHSLFCIVHLFGLQNARPSEVVAYSRPASIRPFEVDPIWTIVVRFTSGGTGVCLGNIDFSNGYDSYHHLSGSQGAFVFDAQASDSERVRFWSERDTEGEWVFPLDHQRCSANGQTHLMLPADLAMPDSGDVLSHQTAEVNAHFVEHCHSRTKSPLGFANTRDVAEVWWGALASAATGRPVAIPLDWDAAEGALGS